MAMKPFEGELDQQPALKPFEGELDAAPTPVESPSEAPQFVKHLNLPNREITEAELQQLRPKPFSEWAPDVITGAERNPTGIPEAPFVTPNVSYASNAEQMAKLINQQHNQLAIDGSPQLNVRPAGVDANNVPLFVTNQDWGNLKAGDKFYANAPGVSSQDFQNVKEFVPEMIATAGQGWKKGLAAAFTSAFGNNVLRSLSVDMQTDDFRSLPKRLSEGLEAGAWATVGEGGGRVASHVLTRSIPNALTKVWLRNTNRPMPERWVDADGNLTEEAMSGFRNLGLDQAEVMDALKDEMARAPTKFRTAEEAVRYAESKAVGVEPMLTDLIDSQKADAARKAIMREIPSAGGDLLREQVKVSSEAARKYLARSADEGAPKAFRGYASNLSDRRVGAGEAVRKALRVGEEAEHEAANALFEAAKAMPQKGTFNKRSNAEAAIDYVERDFGQQIPEVLQNIRRIMAEYGYFGLGDADNEVVMHDLTLNNAAELAKRLNRIRRKTSDEMAKGAYDTVIRGVYSDMASVKAADPALEWLGISGTNSSKVQQFEAARTAWSEYMTRWKDSELIEGLVERSAGPTPKISTSEAYQKLVKASPEELNFITSTLKKSGPEGIDALKETRATVLMNILEDSMDSSSTMLGAPILSAEKFAKNLTQFKDGSLKELMTPAQMMHIKRLERVLQRQKLRGVTSMQPIEEHDTIVRQAMRNVLGSVWLFRHSPTVGGLVASGKFGLNSASQYQKKKAARALLEGTKTATSLKFQKKMYEDTIADVMQKNFPKALQFAIGTAGEAARVGTKEAIRVEGQNQ